MGAVGILAALLAFVTPVAAPQRPNVEVLTSLPLFWGEGDLASVFSPGGGRSRFIVELEKEYHVTGVDTFDAARLGPDGLLILIQPPSIPPDELAALDAWVRGGGRLLILADPDLVWPSDVPPGDRRRPPASTLLDPLFTHWGLALEGMRAPPAISSEMIDGKSVALVNPGRWASTNAACTLRDRQLVAECNIDHGHVVMLADADLVDPRLWVERGQENLSAIRSLLLRLAHPA
jgi:ABC-type uncharacterized transport system/Domain of unknown function (DUF4350)